MTRATEGYEKQYEEGLRKVDEHGDQFVERMVMELAKGHPEAFRVCISCHQKPPCMHYGVGLSTLWQMARETWAARPLDHVHVDAAGRPILRRRSS